MDIYFLLSSIAIFIGVMIVLVFLDKRRRANLQQFMEMRQLMADSLANLKAIQSNTDDAHFTQIAADLKGINAILNSIYKVLHESSIAVALREEEKTKLLRSLVHDSVTQFSRELEEQGERRAKAQKELNQQIERELHHVANQVKELKQSLEDSIKF